MRNMFENDLIDRVMRENSLENRTRFRMKRYTFLKLIKSIPLNAIEIRRLRITVY